MTGITPWHIRVLCDNPLAGGYGIPLSEIGNMTLDQMYMLMADRKTLRRKDGVRSRHVTPLVAAGMTKDGVMKGRAKDGTPIQGRIRGKSVARQLMEDEQKKKGK